MANNDIQYLQGIDTVAYVRLLENAAKEISKKLNF